MSAKREKKMKQEDKLKLVVLNHFVEEIKKRDKPFENREELEAFVEPFIKQCNPFKYVFKALEKSEIPKWIQKETDLETFLRSKFDLFQVEMKVAEEKEQMKEEKIVRFNEKEEEEGEENVTIEKIEQTEEKPKKGKKVKVTKAKKQEQSDETEEEQMSEEEVEMKTKKRGKKNNKQAAKKQLTSREEIQPEMQEIEAQQEKKAAKRKGQKEEAEPVAKKQVAAKEETDQMNTEEAEDGEKRKDQKEVETGAKRQQIACQVTDQFGEPQFEVLVDEEGHNEVKRRLGAISEKNKEFFDIMTAQLKNLGDAFDKRIDDLEQKFSEKFKEVSETTGMIYTTFTQLQKTINENYGKVVDNLEVVRNHMTAFTAQEVREEDEGALQEINMNEENEEAPRPAKKVNKEIKIKAKKAIRK